MEPIVVIAVSGLAVALAITFVLYGMWERKYIKTHFTNEKEIFVAKKNVFSEGEKHKKYDYFIEGDIDGHRNTYHVSKSIFDSLEEGKTYTMTIKRTEITAVKS